MSLFHYFGEQGNEHGGTLNWSEANPWSFPFRGPSPLLGQGEAEELVSVHGDVFVRTFDLTKDEDRVAYCDILTRAYNGWYAVLYIERNKTERLVEWVQRYSELTPAAAAKLADGAFDRGAPLAEETTHVAGSN